MPASKEETVLIEGRYCGPPRSGNGGYSCGVFASVVGAPVVTVTLRAPPPLDTPLVVHREADGVSIHHGDVLVATAAPGTLELEIPPGPDPAAAAQAAQKFSGHREHVFPTCFVCGPDRPAGDGLRVFPGPMEAGQVAAPVQWSAVTPNADATIPDPFLWAVLDCPGYFAVADADDAAVLGRLTAQIFRNPSADEPCTVRGWALDRDGRKRRCGTALYDAHGQVLAAAHATWIEVEHLRGSFV